MRYGLEINGRGSVTVAAYGLADAEHRVEKELQRLWPDARVEVAEVRRGGEVGRIVEEFEVVYRVSVRVEVEASSRDSAVTEALRHARTVLQGSRYSRTALEPKE